MANKHPIITESAMNGRSCLMLSEAYRKVANKVNNSELMLNVDINTFQPHLYKLLKQC